MPDLRKRDGGVLHFDVHGPSGRPAIVLVEGLSAHMLGWRLGFIRWFIDAGYRVVRFDNRDVGRSQRYHNTSYTLADMAGDVHELIDAMGLGSAHVVGQSMGGMIAQQLLLRHPADVITLTLLYTAATPDYVAVEKEVLDVPRATTRAEAVEFHLKRERLCASTKYTFDEAWKRTLGGLMWDRGHDPDGVARQATALLSHKADLRAFAGVAVPTLIIHGTADRLIPHQASIELHDAIPGSELWIIDGLGHDLPVELWPQLTARILANAAKAPRPLDQDRAGDGHLLDVLASTDRPADATGGPS